MIRKGTEVEWKKDQKTKKGKVIQTESGITGEIIDQEMVTRRGKPDDKALIIEKEDGKKAVKLESEVEKT